MTQRNQGRRLLGRHDAGEPRCLQRIAFLDGTRADQPPRHGRHRNRSASHRLAIGHRLLADIDHLDPPARVNVSQLASAALPSPCPPGPDPALPASPALPPALPALALLIAPLPPCEEERQALERNGQVDALQLHLRQDLKGSRREIQHRLDAGRDDEIEDVLGGGRRNGDDGDADAVAAGELLEIVDVVNGHAAARLLPDFLAQVVEERRNLEAFLPESGIVGQRQARDCRRP